MRIYLVFFALFAATCLVRADDIVEKNGICVEEIKELEVCLAGVEKAQGLCILWTRKRANVTWFLVLESKKAIEACKKLMEKMNQCIKGKV